MILHPCAQVNWVRAQQLQEKSTLSKQEQEAKAAAAAEAAAAQLQAARLAREAAAAKEATKALEAEQARRSLELHQQNLRRIAEVGWDFLSRERLTPRSLCKGIYCRLVCGAEVLTRPSSFTIAAAQHCTCCMAGIQCLALRVLLDIGNDGEMAVSEALSPIRFPFLPRRRRRRMPRCLPGSCARQRRPRQPPGRLSRRVGLPASKQRPKACPRPPPSRSGAWWMQSWPCLVAREGLRSCPTVHRQRHMGCVCKSHNPQAGDTPLQPPMLCLPDAASWRQRRKERHWHTSSCAAMLTSRRRQQGRVVPASTIGAPWVSCPGSSVYYMRGRGKRRAASWYHGCLLAC